ncbi:MAG: hypothetical protein ABFD92_18595 [Planctomycetaceae bacterium]|nr:hypothetical protein [Planctomycetaceae bacterium]
MSTRIRWSVFCTLALTVVVLAAGVVTHAQEQKTQTPKLAKAGDTYSPTPAEVADAKGDGPDGKGNGDDDTLGAWFELGHAAGTYMRLSLNTATMSADQRANGIRDPRAKRGHQGKVRGPIGAWLPNPKDTEGWIFTTDWDGRGEGVWGDTKANCIIMHPYTEKAAAGSVAMTFKVPAGKYTLKAKATDMTVTAGDGVKLRVEVAKGGEKAAAPVAEKAFGDKGDASIEFEAKGITVAEGQLIRLVLDPVAHWGADMTKIENLTLTRVK